MEYVDVYDKNRVKTGKILPRGTKLAPGEYEITIQVCILNSKNEMLIQQRQSTKKWWADKWDCSVAGCVISGEESWEAAERETREEVGLEISLEDVRPNMTMSFNSGFSDVYIVKIDVPIERIRIQQEEVQAVRWASREEVFALLQAGKFVDYYPGYLGWIFECQGVMGAFYNAI